MKLKHAIIALVILFICCINDVSYGSNKLEACARFSMLAEKVMTYRQNGTDLQAMLDEPEIANNAVMVMLINRALKKPVWNIEAKKMKEIKSFRRNAGLACMRAMEGK